MRSPAAPLLLLTPGEPAGIGPDLAIAIALEKWAARLAVVADANLLRDRARLLGIPLDIRELAGSAVVPVHAPGRMTVLPVALESAAKPGHLDLRNAPYVLTTLRRAAQAVANERKAALVTGPVQKSVINDAGIAFSGHTEFLAEFLNESLSTQGGSNRLITPVMMLVAGRLRVALATTHLPLHAVPAAITRRLLETVLRVLDADLRTRFGIAQPRILVCGLNPHAGEGGHLGTEEIEIITPVLEHLRLEGLNLTGPLPADTLFVPERLKTADAVLAMYHDQGLPVLKHAGFGEAVNVTLGLPIVRTSVDHGTALDLAGTGRADAGSLRAAMRLAIRLAKQKKP